MTMSRRHLLRNATAALAVAGLALLGPAPAAQADAQSYLNELENEGFYGPITHWLQIGYTICSLSDAGATMGESAAFVYRNTDDTVGRDVAMRVVELANVYLC